MEIFDDNFLDNLSSEAKKNSRLRKNFNLHQSHDEKVQRLLNALEPGTIIPVHRHSQNFETLIILRGKLILKYFDENHVMTDKMLLCPEEQKFGVEIAPGQWHSIEVINADTVIFEVKEGPYLPLKEDEILL